MCKGGAKRWCEIFVGAGGVGGVDGWKPYKTHAFRRCWLAHRQGMERNGKRRDQKFEPGTWGWRCCTLTTAPSQKTEMPTTFQFGMEWQRSWSQRQKTRRLLRFCENPISKLFGKKYFPWIRLASTEGPPDAYWITSKNFDFHSGIDRSKTKLANAHR